MRGVFGEIFKKESYDIFLIFAPFDILVIANVSKDILRLGYLFSFFSPA